MSSLEIIFTSNNYSSGPHGAPFTPPPVEYPEDVVPTEKLHKSMIKYAARPGRLEHGPWLPF